MDAYGTKFIDENGKVYIIVEGDKTEPEALKLANKYFKVSKCNLAVRLAYVLGDTLYFQKPGKTARVVWAVSKGF